MKKVLLFILTIAMLMTLPISAFAAETSTQHDAAWVQEQEALLQSEENLAYNAKTGSHYCMWTGDWNTPKIVNGSLDGNYAGAGTGWHSGNGGDRTGRPTWVVIDFGKEVTFNKVVIYSCTTADGSSNDATMAFSLFIPDADKITTDEGGSIRVGDDYATDSYKSGNHVAGETVYTKYVDHLGVLEPDVCYLDQPVTSRYLMYYSLNQIGGWYSAQVCEIGVYNDTSYVAPEKPAYNNVALGATVTSAQSHEDGTLWSVNNLTDGDRYNMNVANNSDNGQFAGFCSNLDATVTIDIDLGAVKTMDTFTMYPATAKYGDKKTDTAPATFPENYTIQVSETGEDGTWTTVVTATTGIDSYQVVTHKLNASVSARYIRLEAVRGDDRIQISEFEAYESITTPDTPDTPDDSTLSSGDALFSVFYQTRASATAGANDLRIVLIANEAKLQALATTATVKVTFHLTDGTVKSFSHKLGGSDSYYKNIYRTINAGDDTYTAAEGYVIFGDLITDIPDGSDETKSTYDYFTVEIIDNADSSVLLPAVSSKS